MSQPLLQLQTIIWEMKAVICCTGSLRELDNEKAQRLHLLEQRNPGITEVTRWIQDHKDQFRGQVCLSLLPSIACALEGRLCSTPPPITDHQQAPHLYSIT